MLVLLCLSLVTPFIGFANVYDLDQWLTYFPFTFAYTYGVCVYFYVLSLTAKGSEIIKINGGNYFFLNLPNSKVEIDIPVYYFAPLKPQKDESVIPDIFIKRQPSDAGNNFDRELSKIKELIKGN